MANHLRRLLRAGRVGTGWTVRRPASWVALSLCATACGAPGDGSAGSVEVRDSAGIALIEPSPADPGVGGPWHVQQELILGGDTGDGAPVFGYVSDLAVDDEGRIYVLDQQASRVSVFDSAGAFVRSFGGPGEGPGELGPQATSVLARGDTILVADWSQDRLTRYARDGSLVSTEPIPGEDAARTWWTSGAAGIFFRSLGRYTDGQGQWAGLDALVRYRGEERVDTVLVFEYEESDLGGPGAPNVPLIVRAPSWTVMDDGTVAWVKPGEARVRVHGADGAPRSIVSFAPWTLRVPDALETEVLEEKLGDRLEMLGGSRDMLDQLPVEAPRTLPALTSIEAAPGGGLWVQRMGGVEDIHPMALNTPDPPVGFGGATWDVFDDGWRHLATVTLPPGFRLMRVTDDALYGVGGDALDVDRVLRLGLERGAGRHARSYPPVPEGL